MAISGGMIDNQPDTKWKSCDTSRLADLRVTVWLPALGRTSSSTTVWVPAFNTTRPTCCPSNSTCAPTVSVGRT